MLNRFYKYTFRRMQINESKSVKWYWRPYEVDLSHNGYYKGYLVKVRGNNNEKHTHISEYNSPSKIFPFLNKLFKTNCDEEPHVELLPLDSQGNQKYDSVLIWLYDGDFIEAFIEHLLEFNNFPPKNFKILFYRAPVNPITFDTIVLQRNWFNIFDLPNAAGRREINKKEIDKLNLPIQNEIKNQYNLIGDYNKIFLGGFSSSACMALYALQTSKEKLGGCISFSGFNFDFTPIDDEKKKIPILCVNGKNDEVVIIKHARNSYSNFKNLGFNIIFLEEPGLKHSFTRTSLREANKLLMSQIL